MLTKDLSRTLLTTILLAAVALSGCSGDDPEPTPTATPTPTPGGAGTGTPTASPSPTEMPPPPTRYENVTLSQSLADCTLISQAVAQGGDPASAAAGAATVALTEADWGRPFSVVLTGEASDGAFPASAVCVGFSGVGSLSSGTSGTIPADATAMVIGGDFVFSGTVFVTIG